MNIQDIRAVGVSLVVINTSVGKGLGRSRAWMCVITNWLPQGAMSDNGILSSNSWCHSEVTLAFTPACATVESPSREHFSHLNRVKTMHTNITGLLGER